MNEFETKFGDIIEYCDEKLEHDEGTLYFIMGIKWIEVECLYRWLKTIDDKEYLLLEACHDYPESDEMDRGSWSSNPWGLQKSVSFRVTFDRV